MRKFLADCLDLIDTYPDTISDNYNFEVGM